MNTDEQIAQLQARLGYLSVTAKLALAALNIAIDYCTWREEFHLAAAQQAAEQLREAIRQADSKE